VECHYRQISSIDLYESFTPVINGAYFTIILVEMMVWNLKAKIIDIETAILHDDLEERSLMGIPSCMEVGDGKCLVLKKTIYELVQIARQFYVKLVEALKSCRFTGSSVDPCLLFK
jgi:hypothetical protein